MKKFLDASKKKLETNPELTHKKIESLLKLSYNGMVVYHIDTGIVNQRIYNEHPLVGLYTVGSWMPDFKQMWEQSSELKDLQPVMIATKTVHPRFREYDKYGSDVAGNVIVWDKTKKDYYALSPEWFRVRSHMCNQAASEQCLYDVADYLRSNMGMLEGFARSRVR